MENRHYNTVSGKRRSQNNEINISAGLDGCRNIGRVDITTTEEYLQANFCLIPPYCLIEDKEKYIGGAG